MRTKISTVECAHLVQAGAPFAVPEKKERWAARVCQGGGDAEAILLEGNVEAGLAVMVAREDDVMRVSKLDEFEEEVQRGGEALAARNVEARVAGMIGHGQKLRVRAAYAEEQLHYVHIVKIAGLVEARDPAFFRLEHQLLVAGIGQEPNRI